MRTLAHDNIKFEFEPDGRMVYNLRAGRDFHISKIFLDDGERAMTGRVWTNGMAIFCEGILVRLLITGEPSTVWNITQLGWSGSPKYNVHVWSMRMTLERIEDA